MTSSLELLTLSIAPLKALLKGALRACVVLLAFSGACRGQSVAWGTSLAQGSPPLLYLPDGTAMPAGFTWELGWFDAGFVPTMGNAGSWSAKWHTVDSTGVAGSPDHNVNGYIADVGAASGKQAWLWAYADKSSMGVPGAPAVLLTSSSWFFPGLFAFANFDIAVPPSSNPPLLQVVIGRIDRQLTTSGGIQVAGLVPAARPEALGSVTLSAGFEVQAATWPAAGKIWATDWLASFFSPAERQNPAMASWEADPDSDGASNLLEYALGTNPRVSSVVPKANLQVQGSTFQLSMPLAPHALLHAQVMQSANLRDWVPVTTEVLDSGSSLLRQGTRSSLVNRLFYRFHLNPLP